MSDPSKSDEWKAAVERAASGPPLTAEQREDIGRLFGTRPDNPPEDADAGELDDAPADGNERPADPA